MTELVGIADELELHRLVPNRYRIYLPLIERGLEFFLQRLPTARQAEITAAQLALPADAPGEERVLALLKQCPTLHKLGQVVARDPRLGRDLRERLQQLESLASAVKPDAAAIRREIGDIEEVEIGLRALAEGSVAVVVPIVWHTGGMERPGVVKLLKPGIAERLEEELDVWRDLGTFLAMESRQLGLPPLDFRDTLESVRNLLQSEVRLDLEQNHLMAAAERYADVREVQVPQLFPFSTPSLTAMERVFGIKVAEARLSQSHGQQIARTMVDALLARPFWSIDEDFPIHADPHAGNLFYTEDGRLALLDWSLVTRLTNVQRQATVQIIVGALSFDEMRILRALDSLLRHHPNERTLRAAVGHSLRELRQGTIPAYDWLLRLLDRLALDGATFPHQLTLFRKSLFTLGGILSELAPGFSVDATLVATGMSHFMRDLPARSFVSPTSRAFATHLSNADLLTLWTALPAAAARLQLGLWRDSLAPLHMFEQRMR